MKTATVKAHKRKGRTVKSHTRKLSKAPKGWRKSDNNVDPTNLSSAKKRALKKRGYDMDSIKYSGL